MIQGLHRPALGSAVSALFDAADTIYAGVVAASGKKQGKTPRRVRSGHEIVRSIRKPSAPPSRVERPAGSYDRSRRRREIEESMEETS